MNENLRPQDFLGKIIQLHDHVVYPTRRGSALWLSQGTVQDTNYHDDLSREPWTVRVRVESPGACGGHRVVNVPARRCVVV